MCTGLSAGRRRRPTLPPGHPGSTIGAEELNFCVRNGNRWDLFAMATKISILVTIEQQGSFGLQKDMVKPHGSLVSVSSMCCHTSTSDLSTLSSSTSLQVAFATGYLILEGASRLDAFSGYPFRTWLTSGAPGGTTGVLEVRPSWSSRTGDGSPRVSCARRG